MKKCKSCFLLLFLLFSIDVSAQNSVGDSVKVHSVTTNNENAPIIGCVFDVEFTNRSQKPKWFLTFYNIFTSDQIETKFIKRSERQIDWFNLYLHQDLSNSNKKAFSLYYKGDYITLPTGKSVTDSFKAIKLSPNGIARNSGFNTIECNQAQNLVVWEVDELVVNEKESLEDWWDYSLLSSSGLTLYGDNTESEMINIIAWLRKPPSPKSKIAERIFSLEPTNVKKHIIPLKINFKKSFFNKIQTKIQSKTVVNTKK